MLGFSKIELYDAVYELHADDSEVIYKACECIRDLGIPFSTHRMAGADYFLDCFRQEGHVHGKFKRINFFGNDRDDDAPFTIEEF